MAKTRKKSSSRLKMQIHSSEVERKSHSSIFSLMQGNKKIHPAIDYFRKLQKSPSSKKLKKFLSKFDEPRPIDSKVFADGVKSFIALANSNPLDEKSGAGRKKLFGNIHSGLHYNNDLVKLWNDAHPEPIKASHITTFAPSSSWDAILQDGFITLIYRGQKPAQALDQLVKGPTVIDCGMFAQLSLWFGIRYMLGNERFNACFGRTPFFITQHTYNSIVHSNKPYSGNPLHSFLSTKDQAMTSSVTVKHIANSPLYPFKHPGENYGGDNCIVIDNRYYVFDPLLKVTQGLAETEVFNLLRHAFNKDRSQADRDRLSLYASSPNEWHPIFFQTFEELIQKSKELVDRRLTEEEFLQIEQDPSCELRFDLNKFKSWLQLMEENKKVVDPVEYSPQLIDHSLIPTQLIEVIPFENRTSMEFAKFKQETAQQKELMVISKQFCQSIMANESNLVVLTGKAGVGKTASAVCAFKELIAKEKKAVWVSEVMVNGWADQAKSMADLDKCGSEIDKLLATDPDVIFLDDDNLAGFSGNLLLEKIYSWYVQHSGKGLFITSNEPISFKNCYGHKLDGQYDYPPFTHYHSSQYLNWHQKTDLAGESLRLKRDGQSIGAIVSDSSWKMNKYKLEHIEFIPAFDDEEIVPIRQSLRTTGSVGSAYDKLSAIQKKWIDVHEVGGMYTFSGDGQANYEEPHLTANPSKFEKTTSKTIALEIREYHSLFDGKEIDYFSMDQLIRILNYAHDQGGRRIILINQTSFNAEELLNQIKKKLPSTERERTWSRLKLLLCETENSIFEHNEFNSHIKKNIAEIDVDGNKFADRLFIRNRPSYLKKPSPYVDEQIKEKTTSDFSNRNLFYKRRMKISDAKPSRRKFFSDSTDASNSILPLIKLLKRRI